MISITLNRIIGIWRHHVECQLNSLAVFCSVGCVGDIFFVETEIALLPEPVGYF